MIRESLSINSGCLKDFVLKEMSEFVIELLIADTIGADNNGNIVYVWWELIYGDGGNSRDAVFLVQGITQTPCHLQVADCL